MGICRIIVLKLSTNHLRLSIDNGMVDMVLDMVDMVLDMVGMVGMVGMVDMVYDVMAYNHVPNFHLCL